ncbi:cathelicidin antimicrobial peptide-like [Trichosurus vulpecula]|uniref:cathelicidin antimicrobial peptide-like n=1 Tax=Trichosurus vulpecula TaxID=9337 RepID=UPI00186B198A|nr:cathelicidin antimicrobial peptide-like [Trichosurus vulpecula]
MASFRIVLPLLLLGLIKVKATNNQGLTYFDALTIAVTYFNEETNETNSFWLTAAEPQPHWNNTSREPHYLSFTAKETDCRTTENITPITCAFKKNGAIRAKRGVPTLLKNILKAIVKEAVKTGVSKVLKKKH